MRAESDRSQYVNIDRIRRTVDAGPYDAVIVMSPENIPYYAGFYNLDLRLLPERIHLVVWPKHAEPAFVVIDRRKSALRPEDTFLTDIVEYQGEELDSMRAVADVLADRGISNGTIGIEGREFSSSHVDELRRLTPGIEYVDAWKFIESVRLIKTSAEIETLTRVNQMAADAIDAAFMAARPGDTERSIVLRIQQEFMMRGADHVTAPIFSAGPRSGAFHPIATDMPIERGMIVKTDFGGTLDGYIADIARTAVMGHATERQRWIHSVVSEAKDRIVDYINPGVIASDVARLGREVYAEHGLEYKWAILGHGIGLGLHESPQIYPWVDEPIEAGMVLMIETGYNDYPNDSFHVEDLILVEESGSSYLTDASRHAEIWELGV